MLDCGIAGADSLTNWVINRFNANGRPLQVRHRGRVAACLAALRVNTGEKPGALAPKPRSPHRELGHHKHNWAALFYARHTGDHHSFFSEHAMSYDEWRDWRVILFPPWLIVVYLVGFVAPTIWLCSQFIDAPFAWIFGAHSLLGYLLYEFFHTCHHLPQGHWMTRLPWLREMRQLHRLHHRRELMHTHNFNIVLPLMDKLCNTLHWEAPSR